MPTRIEVQLIPADGEPLDLTDILVAIDVHSSGHYYFGSLVDLTDQRGFAATTGAELQQHFRHNQQLFPMDYRVPLADCDSEITIRIQGGREFAEAQETAAENSFMDDADRDRWARARNALFQPSQQQVRISNDPREPVRVTIPVAPIRHRDRTA